MDGLISDDPASLEDWTYDAARRSEKPDKRVGEDGNWLLGLALDMAAEGIAIVRINGAVLQPPTIIYVNDSFCSMMGRSRLELIGMTTDVLDGPNTSQKAVEELRSGMRNGERQSVNLIRHHRDGTPISIDIEAVPIVEPDGSKNHYVVTYRDVTQKRQKLEELRSLSESFKLMFDQNPLPMWAFNAKTLRFLMVNEAAVNFYGWSRDRFLTKHLHDVCIDEVLDSKGLSGQRSMKNPGTYTHQRSDGSVVRMNAVTQSYSFNNTDAIFTVMWDVTDEEKARANLQAKTLIPRELVS